MGVKLDFEAVNELPNPLAPGTIYFVDHGDGTATQVVTDATGQITGRQVVGLMTSGALGRTGAVTTRLNKNATTLGHKFTNTSGAPIVLSSVTVEGIALSAGSATLYVFNVGGQVLASAPATAQSGGLTAPLAYTIPAGESVLIAVVSTGGYLTASLSSGHTWAGLTMADAILYTNISVIQGGMIGEDNGAPTAQLRFQFGTGGQAIRRVEVGDGLTGEVQGGTLRVTRKRIWGDGVTIAGDGNATLPLTMPGSEAWTGRLWRRDAGQEPIIDPTQHPDRLIRTSTLDFTNLRMDNVSDGFNAVFVGLVSPAYSEAYTLNVYSDDGVRVWLDDTLVLDSWTLAAPGVLADVLRSAPLGMLRKDRPYVMRVEWFQYATSPGTPGGVNPNRLTVKWTSPSQPEVLIPTMGASGQAPIGTVDPEVIRDTIAEFLKPGAGISMAHDDPGNQFTISATGAPLGYWAGSREGNNVDIQLAVGYQRAPFNAMLYTTDNNFNLATAAFTAPADGLYLFQSVIGWVPTAAGDELAIALYNDATNTPMRSMQNVRHAYTSAIIIGGMTVVRLTQGQVVSLRLGTSAPVTVIAVREYTHFSITRLGGIA